MARWFRRLLPNLALLLVSVLFSLGAGEVYLRYFDPRPLEAAYVWPDGTLRHLPSFSYTYSRSEFSNRVTYNSLGLRGPEIGPGGKDDTRVLFLGDSFVEGKQVGEDEVLTAVLSEVGRRAGLALEVINAGVSGHGTAEELLLWESIGRDLEPDVVILGFYPNDVRNNADRGTFVLAGGLPIRAGEPRLPKIRWIYDVRKYLSSHSHLYILIQETTDELERRGGMNDGAGALLESEDVFARVPSPEVRDGWSLTLALLGKLREEVEAGGARFVVAVLPTRFQVDDDLWREHAVSSGLEASDYDLRVPQRRIGEWSERTGAAVIDLLESFRARNAANSFYFSLDAHWNPAGHRLAAESLLEEMIARDLLRSGPPAEP